MKLELLCFLKTFVFLVGVYTLIILFIEPLVIINYGLSPLSIIRMLMATMITYICLKFSGIFDGYIINKINEKKRLV